MEKTDQEPVASKETTEESALDTLFKLCGLQNVERLVIDTQGDDARTYVPFGAEGLSVILSLYGDVLRISNVIADETSRILCLASPKLKYYDHDLVSVGDKLNDLAKAPGAGFNLRVLPGSEGLPPTIEPQLSWLDGRWPCIHYNIDGVLVVSTFVIKHDVAGGVLSQQFKIFNTSNDVKPVRYALQFDGASVLTLSIKDQVWRGPDGHNFWSSSAPAPQRIGCSLSLDEHEYDKSENYGFRGSALISVFRNGIQYELPDSIFCAEQNDDSDENGHQENTLAQMVLPSSSFETIAVQYRLHPYKSDNSRSLDYFDSDAFLRNEIPFNWTLREEHVFNPILRRQLEYVLGLCPAIGKPRPGQEYRVPFINDITFESFSSPICDL